MNKSGVKDKKKKWSKGRVRDKRNNLKAVMFDKATYDKLCKEVLNYKLMTQLLSRELKVLGSLPGVGAPSRAPR